MEPIITGIGLVTVLGESTERTWSALLAGRSIADHSRITGFVGPNRAVSMAKRAGAEALAHAGWSAGDCRSADSGIFVGTSKGIIEAWMSGPNAGLALGLSSIDGELSREFGFGLGPRVTISAACSSGLHALVRAAMAIQFGEIKRALVIGVEASVHPLFISSFKRLGVLAPEGYGCRPFDRDRRGFLISEAAAVVCLESPENPIGHPMVRMDHWAAGSDGTHLTAGDPDGKSLRHILRRVIGDRCDLVHAHATGTRVNDPVELAAICASGCSRPWLYSHKGALGHSLGAAGMVSVVLNCQAHRSGIVPPNIRSTRPLAMAGVGFSTSEVRVAVGRSVTIAAGFGGPLAAVGFVNCQ